MRLLGPPGMQSTILSIAMTLAALHGRVVDESPQHRVAGHLTMTFCDAIRMPHQQRTYTCGHRHWRITTDSEGRFVLPGITSHGWYLTAGRSPEVAWYECMIHLDPASAVNTLYVCSYKTQPHNCANPKTFATNVPR